MELVLGKQCSFPIAWKTFQPSAEGPLHNVSSHICDPYPIDFTFLSCVPISDVTFSLNSCLISQIDTTEFLIILQAI